MRVFTATLGTETNSFSPIPTGLDSFRKTMLWEPGAHPDFPTEATGPLWACRQRRRSHGWDVVEGTCAFAMPGAAVAGEAYRMLRDRILGELARALPVDLVALGLHGAMMADGTPDCEGDLLLAVRSLVGPDVAVGALLDLHAHLSTAMIEAADVLVAFKEYPHTDYLARADELLDLLARTARGEIHPTMAMAAPGLVAGFRTVDGPGRAMVDTLVAAENQGLLSASWIHGFPLGDSPDLGSCILTVADGDSDRAQAEARQLAKHLSAMVPTATRPEVPEPDSLADVIARAAAATARPAIIVDSADQPGGGGAGDNVEVVRALLEAGIRDAACGPIWDPQAVGFCVEAGVGSAISLRIGGKCGQDSGRPLDIDGHVVGIAHEAVQRLGDAQTPMGTVAAVEADGVAILLSEIRDQAYDPCLFAVAGVDPARRSILVLKSSEQFRIGFEPLAGEIFHLRRGPHFTQRQFRARPVPLWPFEALPA
jgi:microcystin degradation protein MlrC